MPIPISVVIITKNEETRIEECLKSVAGWADEIILVDDESTDKTREIAGRYTDKVFIRRMDIEGKHRNLAYSRARNQWVLTLDADERLTQLLKEEISRELETNKENALYTIPRKNFIGDYWMQWGGQYPAAQLKLFLKDKFKWEEVEVHPRAFSDGKCGHLNEPMLHYTYKDISDFLRKLNNQTTLEAKKWFNLYKDNPKKAEKKMNVPTTIWRCVDRFFRAYIGKKGWRDGFFGFVNAYFASLYQVISYIKFREMKKGSR
jgi:glycosyltransferase involved in cell wall biosynthesis